MSATEQCPGCGSPAWIVQNPEKDQTQCQRCGQVLGRSVNPQVSKNDGEEEA